MPDTVTADTARDRILDAAERLFAAGGGADGASMRDIAGAAGARLSLLTYYFGTKEALYRAVFARRAQALAERRAVALGEEPGSLEELVRAFILPSVRQRFSMGEQGAAFALLTALEATSPKEAARGVIAEFFDPTAALFIAALGRLYPAAGHQARTEAYLLAVGALVTSMAATERLARLAAGAAPDAERLVAFCVGGIGQVLEGEARLGE